MSVLISMTNGDQYVAELTEGRLDQLLASWEAALGRGRGASVLALDPGAGVGLIVDGAQQVLDRLYLQAATISSIGATS